MTRPTRNRPLTSSEGAPAEEGEALLPEGQCYAIRVKGHLDRQWADWLAGLELTLLDNGETVLFGALADQAALIAVLNKLSQLNLAIVSVNQTDWRST